jgi:RNA 3'-phosphate cyclase
MLHIDGSYGEGGGQILRTAVSLSVLTNTPIEVTQIRANRSNPGLRPQHHLALLIMKELSNADTSGLQIGSSSISFKPGKIVPGSYEFDIGTAGSMVLVFQTILLAVLHANKEIHVRLHGGSDVKWAPSWDYFSQVFLPVLHQMGYSVSAQLNTRGYYPKGGGDAELWIHPMKKDLSAIVFESFYPDHVFGTVHLSNLPDHIAKRMKQEVVKTVVPYDITAQIQTEKRDALSPGVGLTLWTEMGSGKFGSVVIGEKGVSAEKVGKKAIDCMLSDINSKATVDSFLSDQILPYVVLAKHNSLFYVRLLTDHFKTNLWVLKQFFPDADIPFFEQDDAVKVIVNND